MKRLRVHIALCALTAVFFGSCAKEELVAPGEPANAVTRGLINSGNGEGEATDRGSIGTTSGQAEWNEPRGTNGFSLRGTDPTLTDDEGDGGEGEEGDISDDGDDSSDSEKNNRKN